MSGQAEQLSPEQAIQIVRDVAIRVRIHGNYPEVRQALSRFFAGHRCGDRVQHQTARQVLEAISGFTEPLAKPLLDQFALVARTCTTAESEHFRRFVYISVLNGTYDECIAWYLASHRPPQTY